MQLATMLTSIQSAGVAPEVNLRNSWHADDEACKRGIHPGFETQGRRHQKGSVSVAPQKGLMSSKNFLKNVDLKSTTCTVWQKEVHKLPPMRKELRTGAAPV